MPDASAAVGPWPTASSTASSAAIESALLRSSGRGAACAAARSSSEDEMTGLSHAAGKGDSRRFASCRARCCAPAASLERSPRLREELAAPSSRVDGPAMNAVSLPDECTLYCTALCGRLLNSTLAVDGCGDCALCGLGRAPSSAWMIRAHEVSTSRQTRGMCSTVLASWAGPARPWALGCAGAGGAPQAHTSSSAGLHWHSHLPSSGSAAPC